MRARYFPSLEHGLLPEVREGRADDGVAARAARTHLAAQAVHPAVPRAGAAVLQLAPGLRARGGFSNILNFAEKKMYSVLVKNVVECMTRRRLH